MQLWSLQKTKRSNKVIEKIDCKIMVDHIPDVLAEVMFSLMVSWKIYSTRATVSENYRDVPEGERKFAGGIEVP